jgi:copper chaperone
MSLVFTVPDMACAACADRITQAIQAIDSSATVQADPKTKQVRVATQHPQLAIQQAILAAGYTVA